MYFYYLTRVDLGQLASTRRFARAVVTCRRFSDHCHDLTAHPPLIAALLPTDVLSYRAEAAAAGELQGGST